MVAKAKPIEVSQPRAERLAFLGGEPGAMQVKCVGTNMLGDCSQWVCCISAHVSRATDCPFVPDHVFKNLGKANSLGR